MGEYKSLIPTLNNLGIYYQNGLGYSPAAAGPVGGWGYTPGPGFFGKQPMDSLLPRLKGTGSTPGRRFGYPLMNRPSADLNEVMFPRYPVGAGNTPGGDGGVWLQGMPGFQQYWGFGKSGKGRKRGKGHKRRSRKSRKSKRKSRKN